MYIYEKFKILFSTPENRNLSVSDIKKRIWEYDDASGEKRTNPTSIIPSDYCYNRTNIDARNVHLFILEKSGYTCLGVNYPYTGLIYHRTRVSTELRVVGRWVNGRREIFEHEITSTAEMLHIQTENDDEFEFFEGKEKYVLHRTKERNANISKLKKEERLLAIGCLSCDVCGFDFNQTYGERGYGFIECHHNKPISELTEESVTQLDDLSLLCSNCHRIIHRIRPWISVSMLRECVARRNKLPLTALKE